MTDKQERVIILIDGSNFYHSIKDTFGVHDNEVMDFHKLVEQLKKNRLLIGSSKNSFQNSELYQDFM